MKSPYCFTLLALAACWPDPVNEPMPEVVSKGPLSKLRPFDDIRITFSLPVEVVSSAVFEGSRALEHGVRATGDEQTLVLSPRPSWPRGARLTVPLQGFSDRLGRPLYGSLEFETEARTTSISAYVSAPPVGTFAPINLRRLAVSLSPADTPVRSARLVSSDQSVDLSIEARDDLGSLVLGIDESSTKCGGLCPNERYELQLSLSDGSLVTDGLAVVATSTGADLEPPHIIDADLDLAGTTMVLRARANEAVWLSATISSSVARQALVRAEPMVGDFFAVTATELQPLTTYEVKLDAIDLAGQRMEPKMIRFVTPHRVTLFISEVVATPLHDWNDSVTAGAPFDGSPGGGAVTDTDEWIELVNASGNAIDLETAGVVVRALDATPTETRLASAQFLAFGSGGSVRRWLPGEALVARLRGSMSQRGLVLEVYAGRALLDRIEVSDAVTSDHPGGRPPDFIHESIARTLEGGFGWCAPTPLDPRPAPSCQ